MAVIDLKGKIALVTGSARRVGKGIALALAHQGMDLVIHHHGSDHEAGETATEILKMGRRAIIVKADQSQPDQVEQLFSEIRHHYGRLDLLVNNASSFDKAVFLDLTLEQWHHVMDTNLTGPFLCSQHAARLMRETGTGGAIINIADLSAFHPWKSYPHHSVSKPGLIMLP